MKMKIIYFIAYFIFYPMLISAQANYEIIGLENKTVRLGKCHFMDVSFMECVYEHKIFDPYKDDIRIEDKILEIGRNAIRYGDYGIYLRDSVIKTDYPDGILRRDYSAISKKYGGRLHELVIDLKQNTATYFHSIFGDHYYYEEAIPKIDWILTETKENICGYVCTKATATFRGRKWTAWYAEGLQINCGPWKFNGLPGLILKVEDDTKEHTIEAIQIRKSKKSFGYYSSSSPSKMDRTTFNKMLSDYMWDPDNFLAGNPLLPPQAKPRQGTAKKRLFYNPIELD